MARSAAVLLCLMTLAPTLGVPTLAMAQTAQKNPSFNLINHTETPIREFFATPAGRENWGRSRLEGRAVAPGGRFDIRLPADGNCIYDVRAMFADGRAEDRRHVDTCKLDDVVFGGTEPRATPAPVAQGGAAQGGAVQGGAHDPSFRLVNRGKSPIAEVFATVAGAPTHGENLLGEGGALAPQGTRQFTFPPSLGCRYDLRVVFADHQSREKKGTDLCRTGDLPVQ